MRACILAAIALNLIGAGIAVAAVLAGTMMPPVAQAFWPSVTALYAVIIGAFVYLMQGR